MGKGYDWPMKMRRKILLLCLGSTLIDIYNEREFMQELKSDEDIETFISLQKYFIKGMTVGAVKG